MVSLLARVGEWTLTEERQSGNEDPEQQRDPAEPGDRAQVDAPLLAGLVDDAQDAGEAPDGRRQDEDDAEREQEAPQDLRVVMQRLPHRTETTSSRRAGRLPEAPLAVPTSRVRGFCSRARLPLPADALESNRLRPSDYFVP